LIVRHAAAIFPVQKHRQVGCLSHRHAEIATIFDPPQAALIARNVKGFSAAVERLKASEPGASHRRLPVRRPQEPDQARWQQRHNKQTHLLLHRQAVAALPLDESTQERNQTRSISSKINASDGRSSP